MVLGFTYALPNLYPTQPSIQVAYTDSGKSADQILLNELGDILDENNIIPQEIFLILIQVFHMEVFLMGINFHFIMN